MQTNRSMPTIRVIPVLSYPDVNAAVEWLSSTFDFTLRWRAGNHRAQLNIIDGCVVVTKSADSQRGGHSVMVRVDDVDVHNSKVSALGARIIQPLTDYPYGSASTQ